MPDVVLTEFSNPILAQTLLDLLDENDIPATISASSSSLPSFEFVQGVFVTVEEADLVRARAVLEDYLAAPSVEEITAEAVPGDPLARPDEE